MEDNKDLFPNPAADENQWWRAILGNIMDIVMTVDREGKILFINHTIPGFTIDKVIGTTIYNYIPAGYQEAEKQALERVFRTGETVDLEVVGSGPDGTASYYQSHFAPLKGPSGSIDAITLISMDVTKQKMAEDETSRLKKEIEELKAKLPSP